MVLDPCCSKSGMCITQKGGGGGGRGGAKGQALGGGGGDGGGGGRHVEKFMEIRIESESFYERPWKCLLKHEFHAERSFTGHNERLTLCLLACPFERVLQRFHFKIRRDHKKIFYERCVYESVDNRSLYLT